jgi:hypothetical protein
LANAFEIANPIPEPPPVTIAFLSFNENTGGTLRKMSA